MVIRQPAEPLLALRNVSARFGGVKALEGIDLEVRSGELVSLVGPNGAGKSTLLNSINGLIRSNVGGDIRLDGVDLNKLRPSEVARQGVARSFQHPALLEKETVLENVMAGAHLRMKYRLVDQLLRWNRVTKIEQALMVEAREILETMNLGAIAQKTTGNLPYAALKMVDIARAIIMKPRLILLDEPTSGLGTGEQELVVAAIRHIRETSETAIILVEHHIEIVRALSDTVVGLQAGRALKIGSPADVLDSPEFRVAIVGGRRDEDELKNELEAEERMRR